MKYSEYIKHADCSLFDVMGALEKLKKKVVYIVDDKDALLGAITDGDIRRYALNHHSFDCVAKNVMKSPCSYATSKKEALAMLEHKKLSSVPLVDASMKITDFVFDEVMESSQPIDQSYLNTTVVMMAGGRGERLYPYTAVLPKPLIPVNGIPIAQRILQRFSQVGLTEVILSLNYKKNIIKAYFDEAMSDLHFTYIEEEMPLGTAGSLRFMKEYLNDDFFVINCDMLIDIDIEDFIRYHKEQGNMISVVSSLKAISIPYGVFDLGKQGEVERLREKPVINQFINTGMYIVNPKVIDYVPESSSFHMTDLMQVCIDRNQKVGAYIINDDAFMDMGQMEELEQMQKKLRP